MLTLPWAVALAAIFGLAVGSFLNVCIHRLPRGESLAFPGSHCPRCGAPVRARENIPVISWLLLGGRCRLCRGPISVRYPVVELSNAIAWAGAALVSSSLVDFFRAAIFCSGCLALIFIDYDTQLLPDVITLPLAATGFILSFFSREISWRASLAGLVLGAGGLFLVAWGYEKLAGHEGMGMGDVKMLGAVGAFTGVAGVVFTLFFGALAGSVIGLTLMASSRGNWKTRLPFGVFLGLAGIAALFWTSPLWRWYTGLYH